MDDLIHRADAVEALRDALSDLTLSHREHKMTMQCLDDLPTVEPRAKGHWIELPGVIGVAYCSECNYQLAENNTNFCPNCGADMRGGRRMIKAEWTNKDSLDLQPTCNQLATTEGDLISRQAAIDRATKEHDFFRGAVTVSDKARRDELLNVVCWLGELPTIKPRKGKWKQRIVDSGFNADWVCSECGYHLKTECVCDTCPKCKADMREVTE